MGPECELVGLLSALRDHLGYRRIEAGLRLLETSRPLIEALRPEVKHAGILAGLVAQWVDAGFENASFLRRLLLPFSTGVRGVLPLHDYLHLRMAEGVIAMSGEDFDRAIDHFQLVRSLENEVADPELVAIANFWTGRCLRRTGRYDDALHYIARGEELALACGYTQMAAIMQATRSWLAFQKGKLHDAITLLGRAEEALRHTDDFLSRGNIQSAYGRIARRQGRYQRALECFEQAIADYRRGGRSQLQLARALLNLAFVRRALALESQRECDLASASRRAGREDEAQRAERLREVRLRIEAVRGQARGNLDEAMSIYEPHHNRRGIAGVYLNRGFLSLDAGDLECAAAEGAEAFRQGDEKRDYIIMARARILQCIVEHAAVEEQLGDPARRHEAAEIFAREAVHFAGQTQNRRLLARAYVWQGLTAAAEPYRDTEAARQCYERATALLETESSERQHVWDELQKLRHTVLDARPLDPLLRAWSAGVVGDKSFQQITEEFSRLIIPKVWEREGRKVSRVAERLSISPKKVRRILQAAGLRGDG